MDFSLNAGEKGARVGLKGADTHTHTHQKEDENRSVQNGYTPSIYIHLTIYVSRYQKHTKACLKFSFDPSQDTSEMRHSVHICIIYYLLLFMYLRPCLKKEASGAASRLELGSPTLKEASLLH